MNAIITPSCLQKYVMWNKVRELKSTGLNNSQISLELGIYRGTVRKYLLMSEDDFLSSNSYRRLYSHKLDVYEDYIRCELSSHPYLSSSQIHDRLKEHYPSFPCVNPKTVYNYVLHVRCKHGLAKSAEQSFRPYEQQPEDAYGAYGQVDFGERYLSTTSGGSVKVYFLAMVLSRSREKFIYFSLKPFTTDLAVYAHELAFEYYGGFPEKLLYDQDKVLLYKENLGDLLLTQGFRKFVRAIGFEAVFCRKSDPESKGKVENVVKYVKYNFLRGRTFTDIDTLNAEGLRWLERTGNGCVHGTTKQIPHQVFLVEKEYLKPYTGTPALPQTQMKSYYVRKDNTIHYKGNYYTLPTGTYKGQNTIVYLQLQDDKLHLFDKETGKTLAIHSVCTDKGKLVRNTSHARDRTVSLQELEDKVKKEVHADSLIDEYLESLHRDKSRYYRDNLTYIDKHYDSFPTEILHKSFEYCLQSEVYNAVVLMEVAQNLQQQSADKSVVEKQPVLSHPSCDYNIIPQKTDINVFKSIFQ